MIIKIKKYAFYIGIALLFILTMLSAMWTQYGNLSHPPTWAMALGLFSFFIGIIILFCFLIGTSNYCQIGKQSKTGYHALEDFLANLPELRGILDNLKLAVKRREIVPGTEHFESIISELRHEFKVWIGVHFMRRLKEFRRKVIYAGLFTIIFVYACFYIADYSVEMYFYRTPGFCIKAIPGGSLVDFFVESLYYSVTTFTTLGYGDIFPKTSILARIISISEVLLFVIFTSVIINFGLFISVHQKSIILKVDDMIKTISDSLESSANDK